MNCFPSPKVRGISICRQDNREIIRDFLKGKRKPNSWAVRTRAGNVFRVSGASKRTARRFAEFMDILFLIPVEEILKCAEQPIKIMAKTDITLKDEIAELKEEIRMRHKVYGPKTKGPNAKMKQSEMDFKIGCIEKTLARLVALEATQTAEQLPLF